MMAILAVLALAGCQATQSAGYGASTMPGARMVEVEAARGLHAADARCVTVLPFPARPDNLSPADVEAGVALHLGRRFDRVIGPAQRDRILRGDGMALDHEGDRKAFARRTACRLFMAVAPYGEDSTYAGIWAERRVGLELALSEAGGAVLWRARHVARRGDGGLPFGVLAAAGAAVRAGRLWSDPEAGLSLLDDALRRITATLPDFRDPGAAARR